MFLGVIKQLDFLKKSSLGLCLGVYYIRFISVIIIELLNLGSLFFFACLFA